MLGQETISFLEDLRANNSRDWMNDNKARYNADWKEAGKDFAERLSDQISSKLGVSMRSKVFRLNRDLRFSKDKTPYNTHLHISIFASDGGPDTPAFMFGLEPGKLSLGMGVFAFSKPNLETWRNALVSDDDTTLIDEIHNLSAAGYRFNDPDLKKVPRGYPEDHANGEWLRRKGLHVWRDGIDITACFGAQGPENCAEEVAAFFPLYRNLTSLMS